MRNSVHALIPPLVSPGVSLPMLPLNKQSVLPVAVLPLPAVSSLGHIREFKKTTTATATGTLPNKRFNEQNNGCARALQFLVRF